MLNLIFAAVIWIAVHQGIAGSRLREAMAGPLGENGFRAVFSLISVAALGLLILAFRAAPAMVWWHTPPLALDGLALVMLVASVFFMASIAAPNPTAVGQEDSMAKGAKGFQRITRHPMLWSFALWGIVHILANGEAAACVFFGAFTISALAGMRSIDRKLKRRDPYNFTLLARESSVLPGAALFSGRTKLQPGEIPWYVPVAGFLLWIGLILAHKLVIGVPAVPG